MCIQILNYLSVANGEPRRFGKGDGGWGCVCQTVLLYLLLWKTHDLSVCVLGVGGGNSLYNLCTI